jgi:hypothetical protein
VRSFIKILVVLLICLVGIGLYRGWFSVSSDKPDAEGDKVKVTVSVDKGKMKSDVAKAKEKLKEEIRDLEGKMKAKDEKN